MVAGRCCGGTGLVPGLVGARFARRVGRRPRCTRALRYGVRASRSALGTRSALRARRWEPGPRSARICGNHVGVSRPFWPGAPVSDSEHAISDSEHGISDSEHAISDSEHGISDLEHAISDSEHAISDPEHAISDSEHAISDPEHAISDSEHGISDSEHAISDSERAISESERGRFWPYTFALGVGFLRSDTFLPPSAAYSSESVPNLPAAP